MTVCKFFSQGNCRFGGVQMSLDGVLLPNTADPRQTGANLSILALDKALALQPRTDLASSKVQPTRTMRDRVALLEVRPFVHLVSIVPLHLSTSFGSPPSRSSRWPERACQACTRVAGRPVRQDTWDSLTLVCSFEIRTLTVAEHC